MRKILYLVDEHNTTPTYLPTSNPVLFTYWPPLQSFQLFSYMKERSVHASLLVPGLVSTGEPIGEPPGEPTPPLPVFKQYRHGCYTKSGDTQFVSLKRVHKLTEIVRVAFDFYPM